jgi:(p)ppGpp synthase/HD superfamily hydrolase
MYSFRIEQAIRAAAILHQDQLRKGAAPVPYVTHLFAVAMLVAEYTEEEDTVVAALLHDTLEDTDYTAAELQEDFGGPVRELVEALTEVHYQEAGQVPWRERKARYAKQLKQAPEAALLVAAADKIHNMRTLVEEYYDDPIRFRNDFPGSLDDRVMMYHDISNTLNRRLKNDILSEFNHVYSEYQTFLKKVRESQQK